MWDIGYIFNLILVYSAGHHECEILERECDRVAESWARWQNCQKNPRHKEFIPVKDFTDKHLPWSATDEQRNFFKGLVELTVRLRVHWTTQSRPDDDGLSELRGTNRPRLGTGFLSYCSDRLMNKPCPCDKCEGNVATQPFWILSIETAHHVVYNTEEAKETLIDLFYDDDKAEEEGRMMSMWAFEMDSSHPYKDFCTIRCATHDETLAGMVQSMLRCWTSLFEMYKPQWELLQEQKRQAILDQANNLEEHTLSERFENRYLDTKVGHVVIVSHPHGQAKKITVGKNLGEIFYRKANVFVEPDEVKYHTATCPGSSGAPVFVIFKEGELISTGLPVYSHALFVHSGNYTRISSTSTRQLNYGYRI